MKRDIEVAILQADLIWEDTDANLKKIDYKLDEINKNVDLIVLPEMFSTGFSMSPENISSTMKGKAIEWLKNKALKLSCVITGSIIINENEKYFNRLIWMRPDGSYNHYDKRHLFRMSNEHHHYAAGSSKLIVELVGWRFCPLICYDLRFPVWSRNKNDYDVLIYVANWPESRRHVWSNLLIARALENQSYVIGVNRIGKDGYGASFSGDSVIISPKGEIITSVSPHDEGIAYTALSASELKIFRKAFPVHLDADDFDLSV